MYSLCRHTPVEHECITLPGFDGEALLGTPTPTGTCHLRAGAGWWQAVSAWMAHPVGYPRSNISDHCSSPRPALNHTHLLQSPTTSLPPPNPHLSTFVCLRHANSISPSAFGALSTHTHADSPPRGAPHLLLSDSFHANIQPIFHCLKAPSNNTHLSVCSKENCLSPFLRCAEVHQ